MVDDPKIEERKNFMRRNKSKTIINNCFIAHFTDPLKKREEFSVSLRKAKKAELITTKRKKAFNNNFSPSQEDSLNEDMLP